MKKILALLMLMVLMVALLLPAVAVAEGNEPALVTPEFFSWDMLATEAGCVAAVLLIVQLFKGIGFVAKMPTRVFAYIIALPVLLAAAYFSGNLTWSFVGLAILNAAVVSLSANGLYDAALQLKNAITKT